MVPIVSTPWATADQSVPVAQQAIAPATSMPAQVRATPVRSPRQVSRRVSATAIAYGAATTARTAGMTRASTPSAAVNHSTASPTAATCVDDRVMSRDAGGVRLDQAVAQDIFLDLPGGGG